MLSHQELEKSILKKNLIILSKKEHCLIRKTDSWRKGTYHRAGNVEKYFSFICKCPNEGCSNTFSITRLRDLNRNCRSCSVTGIKKEDKQPQEWQLLTDDIAKAVTPLAKANPGLFLREEHTISGHKRVILKCSTPNCFGEISTNPIRITEVKRTKCTRCSQKARPYERAYNIAKKRMEIRFPNAEINWKLSYDDFYSLCEIPNCHYCNVPLKRAKHRTSVENLPKHALACLLDRKDSSKDYTLDNCVPCCPDCNFTKNEHISYDEMVLIMKHRGLWIDKEISNV